MGSTFFVNNQAVGPDAQVLNAAMVGSRFIPEIMQPWLDDRNRPCVTLPIGKYKIDKDGKQVLNAKGHPVESKMDFLCSDLEKMGIRKHPVWNTAYVKRDAWIHMQTAVIQATRQRLRAWADLAASNTLSGFDGMGTYTIEYDMANDPGEAIRNMELIGDLRHDEQQYKTASVPLPITQSGFHYTERRMAVAAASGRPVQPTSAEWAGRRIAESMERVTIGTSTGVTYGTRSTGPNPHEGTSTEYGYTNFPYRITKTDLNTPTGNNSESVFADVIEMRELMYSNGFYGPFMVYGSTSYDQFLDRHYTVGTSASGLAAPNQTLRQAITQIDGIMGFRRLDFLTNGYQLIMVQMTSDVAQAAIGRNITVVQWPELGGALQKFRVFMIAAPLLHRNFLGEAGIVHGTTS